VTPAEHAWPKGGIDGAL
jgi:hypothetical protein